MANEASKFTMADGTDVTIVDSRIGDLSSTGVTGATVAAQLSALNSNLNSIIGNVQMYDCTRQTGQYTIFSNKEGLYIFCLDCQNIGSGGMWNVNVAFNTGNRELVSPATIDWQHNYSMGIARFNMLRIDVNTLPTNPTMIRLYYLKLRP